MLEIKSVVITTQSWRIYLFQKTKLSLTAITESSTSNIEVSVMRKINTRSYHGTLDLFFRKFFPTMENLMKKFSDKRYFTCEPNSRTVSVALDRLKPWTDSDIRDRNKDVRRHFLRILKQSQPTGEEKVNKIHKKWHWGLRDGAILERRRDCKRNTLLTFYSVVQSAEIGLVENQPNTSIKRKEKKNQEKEPKQKEVGEEMLRTDLREMEQG